MTATPIRAQDFLNTLGVDTHIAYTDGGYANIANIAADLKYLGIRSVRDGLSTGVNGSAPFSSYVTLAQEGVKFTIILFGGGTITTGNLQSQIALAAELNTAVAGSVVAIEGANEINNFPITYNGVSGLQGAINLQQDMYSKVDANAALAGVAVDYFTGYNAGTIGVGPNPETTTGLADYDTQHPYPNFGQAPYLWVNRTQALGNETPASGPAVYTETGYSTNGGTSGAVNADVQAKYTLDLLMDDAKNGIARTYLYQLMDAYQPGSPQGDDGFGLFDLNNQPKEPATAIHDLTAILADTGSTASTFTPMAFNDSVANLPSTGNSLVLEKSNGATDIVVWNEPEIWNESTGTEITAAPTSVTVSLGGIYQTVKVFDPLLSSSAEQTYSNVGSVVLQVADHPLIVEVEPQATPPVTTSGGSDTLSLNVAEIAMSGKNAAFTVSVDGTQVGGVQTVTGLETAGGGQTINLTGNFGAPGPHTVAVSYLDGFTGAAADWGRMLFINAVSMDGLTVFPDTQTLYDSTYSYTLQKPATPVLSNAGMQDTLVLNLSELAVGGKNAMFMMSVDGQFVGGIQSVTASQAAGQSQNVTLTGDFGTGAHNVAIDFLNGFSGNVADQGRTLYVNSITLDGKTTTENTSTGYNGAVSYTVHSG